MTNGGPAFPVPHSIDGNWVPDPRDEYKGMTLRDYFAAAALTGWISSSPTIRGEPLDGGDEHAAAIAKMVYAYANAMLKAREP